MVHMQIILSHNFFWVILFPYCYASCTQPADFFSGGGTRYQFGFLQFWRHPRIFKEKELRLGLLFSLRQKWLCFYIWIRYLKDFLLKNLGKPKRVKAVLVSFFFFFSFFALFLIHMQIKLLLSYTAWTRK